MTVNSGWSEREETVAKALWLEGKSASEIAARLPGRTRNAVIGRIHRLGMSKEGRAPAAKIDTYRPAKAFRAPAVARSYIKPPKPGPQAKPGAVFGKMETHTGEELEQRRLKTAAAGLAIAAGFAAPANDTAIKLVDRRRFQCAWPVGEPDRPANQMCCGLPVPDDANPSVESYCAAHAVKAVARVLTGGKPDVAKYIRSLRRVA